MQTDVVRRAPCPPGLRITSVDVDPDVLRRAARAPGIGDRIKDQRLVGQRAAGRVGRHAEPSVGSTPRPRGAGREAFDGGDLLLRPDGLVEFRPQVGQQDAVDRVEARVREGQARHQAVEQSRIHLRDHELLDRAARAAAADEELRHAVALDDVFLDHHQRFALEHAVAAAAVHELRRNQVAEALRQRLVVQHAATRRRRHHALDVLRAGTAAERHHELAIPVRQVVEDRELVDRAVDNARVDAHDVRHRLAVRRGGGSDVGGRGSGIEGLERVVRRSIEAPGLRRRGAMGVERRAEPRRFGTAFKRREVRAREDRAGDRVIRHREGGFGARLLRGRRQPVRTWAQALDQSAELTARSIAREARRDVLAVQRHVQLVERRARRRLDRDEGIAAADQIGPRRQRANLERCPRFNSLPGARHDDRHHRQPTRSLHVLLLGEILHPSHSVVVSGFLPRRTLWRRRLAG